MPSVVNECTEGLAKVCGLVLRKWVTHRVNSLERILSNLGVFNYSHQHSIEKPSNSMTLLMKLTAFIPPDRATQVNEVLRNKGPDFDVRNVKGEDLQELLNALSDLEINIHNDKEKVHIYVEKPGTKISPSGKSGRACLPSYPG